jgi:hypothetical protein
MIHRSLLLMSMFSCAFAWGCSGRIDLGTGSLDSGAAAEGGVLFGDASLARAQDAAPPPNGETCDDNGTAHAKGTTWQCACNTCSCVSPPAIDTTTAFCFDASDEVDESADSSEGSGGTCPDISITVSPNVPRFLPGGDTAANAYPSRPQNLDPSAIDYKDCTSNINLEFTLDISGLPCTDTIQAWVGTTDCTQITARQAKSGGSQCWQVTKAIELQSSTVVNLRAQDLVAFIGAGTTYMRQGVAACQSLLRTTPHCDGSAVPSLSLYFMAIEADGVTLDGTPAAYSFDTLLGSPDGGLCEFPADAGP